MKIRWFGQACFLLTSSAGTRLLMDPFGRGMGYKVPRVEADVVTISHHHSDHDNTGAVLGADFACIDRPGSFREGGLEILGIPTFHDKVHGKKRGPNVVYRVTIDGIAVCHCGDLGHALVAGAVRGTQEGRRPARTGRWPSRTGRRRGGRTPPLAIPCDYDSYALPHGPWALPAFSSSGWSSSSPL